MKSPTNPTAPENEPKKHQIHGLIWVRSDKKLFSHPLAFSLHIPHE
jgi:hypothetical protein